MVEKSNGEIKEKARKGECRSPETIWQVQKDLWDKIFGSYGPVERINP
jgi:hypothetical protein